MLTKTINKKVENTQDTFLDIRKQNISEIDGLYQKCQTNSAFIAVFDKLLDNNIQTLDEIVSKQKSITKYTNSDSLNELNSKINELEDKKQNSKELKLEKNTLILITDQRNKNIELYYVVYIIFVALFVIIQSSILIFK
jgi:hypothetical protein